MTRGMKGCYVYCCDPALSEYLRYRLQIMSDKGQAVLEYELQEELPGLLVADDEGNNVY